jgi:cytochrome c oxidase accessory protein FixG
MNAIKQSARGIQLTGSITEIYGEYENWNVNTGSKTIHAKRMPGFFRTLKTWTQLRLWLPFFLLPYLRWNGKQAILFDIDHSQFHFFGVTVFPDDIWMLSLVLLLAAMVLFAVTAIASRVWCGYFCFQTAWTDWFTWIEDKIEGNPTARRKLDAAPWSADKLVRKCSKHTLWMALSLFTGISFSIWFVDAYDYWNRLLHLQLPTVGWVVLTMFFFGTYLLAGFLREQACFWMCPYARIQGVMTDAQTVLPTYDVQRGEPRSKLRKGNETVAQQGDCIDCFQCVQVCPTGIDIRQGQQLGCITCGLRLDACDSIMDKISKPRGLIRYASLNEMAGSTEKNPFRQPRTMTYLSIVILSIAGIVYGFAHMTSINMVVMPERQPMFVQMSDGSIQNKYDFRVQNKTGQDLHILISTEGGVNGQQLIGAEHPILISHKRGATFSLFVKAPQGSLTQTATPLRFHAHCLEDPNLAAEYETHLNGPGI